MTSGPDLHSAAPALSPPRRATGVGFLLGGVGVLVGAFVLLPHVVDVSPSNPQHISDHPAPTGLLDRPQRLTGDLEVIRRLEAIEAALRAHPPPVVNEPDPNALLALSPSRVLVRSSSSLGGSVVVLAERGRPQTLLPNGQADVDDDNADVSHRLLDAAFPSPTALAALRPLEEVRQRRVCAMKDRIVDFRLRAVDHLLEVIITGTGEHSSRTTVGLPLPGAPFAFDVRCDDLVEAPQGQAHIVAIYVAGIEAGPLDRSHGAFENIDSVLSRYTLDLDAGTAAAGEVLNLSDVGVVSPKAVAVGSDVVYVAGAATGLVGIVDRASFTVTRTEEGLVGAADLVLLPADDDGSQSMALASPLADAVAFVTVVPSSTGSSGASTREVQHLSGPRRDALTRLGEALLTTTALAPQQRSEGPASRFSCEACHLDLGVDGRVHATARFTTRTTGAKGPDHDGADNVPHEIRTSTKPLWGVFQNPPLFTRGLDRSVGAMVDAEVAVANARTPRSPWTTLVPAVEAPFLADVLGSSRPEDFPRGSTSNGNGGDVAADVAADVGADMGTGRVLDVDAIDPFTQRVAMVRAFAALRPPPIEHLVDPETEARGYAVFRAHCLRCHAPRRYANEAASLVDVDDDAIRRRHTRAGDLVWGSDRRDDVGVRPLVHPEGARPSSLRRISHKRPLLSAGLAPNLERFVSGLRFAPPRPGVDPRGKSSGPDDEPKVWHVPDVDHHNDDAPNARLPALPLTPSGQADLVAFLQTL